MPRALAILVVFGVLVGVGTALAEPSDEERSVAAAATTVSVEADDPVAATGEPVPPPGPGQPEGVTLALSDEAPSFGARVRASGSSLPTSEGQEIVLEIDVAGDGGWTQFATAMTDGTGAYAVEFDALAAGALRARAVASGATSVAVRLGVGPVVRARAARGTAFAGARVAATIQPASYSGRAVLVVRRDGNRVGRVAARVRAGRLSATVPTPGVGVFWVELRLPARAGLAARSIGLKVRAHGRTLRVGSAGPDVRGLRARLAALRFHVPAADSTFGPELADAVIAFQKAYGLPRTSVVDAQAWRVLAHAEILTPRYRAPAHHIEVDKTRQILLEVRGGEVVAVLPVSTGATGNTPEGRHAIRWKALATTTWLGPAILYRTMTFVGNSFAIHGFPSVPPYPASHGCVRIPIWAADWLYQRSPVGETVYVYR